MKRGFTIIELLVASLLLGMLVTILTMIFNQSSIAWRTGAAMTANMDGVRDNIAVLREEADNAFVYNDDVYRHVGLWKSGGSYRDLRDRACDAPNTSVQGEVGGRATLLRAKAQGFLTQRKPWKDASSMLSVDGADGHSKPKNYTVNVMSYGPHNEKKDPKSWQAILSTPDDPEEWCK